MFLVNLLLKYKVYIFYFVFIMLLATPRVVSGGWRGITEPMDMRLLDGWLLQHEARLVLRSTASLISNDHLGSLVDFFSTDEYRALLPIGFAGIFTSIFQSYYIGNVFSEIVWWWMGAVATNILTKRLGYSSNISMISGLFVGSSPLAIAQIGAGHLHAASSLSLPVAILIAWHGLFFSRSFLFSVILIGFAILFSSTSYNYQWVLIPSLFIFGLFPKIGRAHV